MPFFTVKRGTMDSRAALLALLTLLLPGHTVTAQSQVNLTGTKVPVVIENLAPIPRGDTWVSFTVPDKDLPNPATLAPQGYPVYLGKKVGPTARLVHVRIPVLGSRQKLYGWIAPTSSMATHEKPKRDLVLGPNSRPGLVPVLAMLIDKKPVEWTPTKWEIAEEGPARVVFHAWGRVPGSMLVVNWWFYVYTAYRTVNFELTVTNSDTTTQKMVQTFDGLGIETSPEVFPHVHYNRVRGGQDPTFVGDRFRVILSGPSWLGFGQGMAFKGRLLFWTKAKVEEFATLLAELHAPVVGQALNWAGSWGPWGVVPDLHPDENKASRGYGQAAAREVSARFRDLFASKGSMWDLPPYGLRRIPAFTGDQQDFGSTKLAPALAPKLGNPAHLYEVGHSILFEAGRPSYFYEPDGRRIRAENHPKLVFWGLYPHFHPNVSPDRLGKKPWTPTPWNGPMAPKDWSHMSSNNLAGWTLLTGSHLGLHLIEHEVEGWLLGSAKLRWLGEPRAVGRSMRSVAWHYLVTGDERIRNRFNERFNKGFQKVLNPKHKNWKVTPLGFFEPDGRALKGKYWYWTPWQEGLGIVGIDAANQLVNNARGHILLRRLCKSFITYGWWHNKAGRWVVGVNVRYRRGADEGKPIPPSAYLDRTQATDHRGTDFDVWNWAAVKIALRYARQTKDSAYIRRCESILAQLKQDRKFVLHPPARFDRVSEWKAVR